MTALEKYYNKFNEDHRLTTRHGQVEFTTTMKYIHDFIPENQKIKILDVGAGTGAYSIPLSREGHSVTAVELVERNLRVLESKHEHVNCWPGNAMDLSFLDDDTFDITLVFGPMYHLISKEEKLKAFSEVRRVTKNGGHIFVAYVLNDYSVITYCFKQNNIRECMERKSLTTDFHQIPTQDDLYSYLRLSDIDELNSLSGLKREKIIAADGAADYIRRELNALDEESFKYFIQYHLANCERPELLGASSHVVDILVNKK